jgi:hypothetical protein
MLEDKSRAHLLDIKHGKWYQIGVKAAAIT